jgi:hypothetical protein
MSRRGRSGKIKQEIAEDIEVDVNLSALAEAFAGGNITSPQEFGMALLEAFGPKAKFPCDGLEVGISYEPQTPFCIFEAEIPLAHCRYPQTGHWNLPGSDVDVAIEFSGKLKIRFGPNERGWQWMAQRARPAAQALIERILLATGSESAGIALLRAGGFVAAVAAITGAVTYSSAFLCGRAQRDGLNWSLAREYAVGYVGVLWVPIGIPIEDERAFDRAQGNLAPSSQHGQARRLGVAHAIRDIVSAGSGQRGAIVVRANFYREFHLRNMNKRRPSRDSEGRAREALAEYMRRTGQTPRLASAGLTPQLPERRSDTVDRRSMIPRSNSRLRG